MSTLRNQSRVTPLLTPFVSRFAAAASFTASGCENRKVGSRKEFRFRGYSNVGQCYSMDISQSVDKYYDKKQLRYPMDRECLDSVLHPLDNWSQKDMLQTKIDMLTGSLHGHVCWRQQLDKALLKRKNNKVKTKYDKFYIVIFFAHFSLRRPHHCIWTLQEQASKIRQR